MKITGKNTLKQIITTPTGHDVIARLLYSLGLDENLIRKTPLGNISLNTLTRFTRLTSSSKQAVLEILNSLTDEELPEKSTVQKQWWKQAVFYQIYPRCFKDSDNNGIGDLKGIISKLDYLKELGVDAIWCSPFYDSPNADNGYDIRDYRKVNKELGSDEDIQTLFDECHKRDIKIIIDMVMNHTSDEHEWFQKALAGDKKYQDYYIWSDKPNNWDSLFAGSAWKYFPQVGKYALHLFDEKQMDLNWDNPQVREEMYSIANWWLDKGADGFRLDVVSFISKREGLPDGDPTIGSLIAFTGVEHYFHGPHLDEYLREFNEKCLKPHNAYTVGECPGIGLEMARMMCGDDRNEISQLFSFDHIENPGRMRVRDVYDYDLRKAVPELMRWQLKYSNHCWPTLFFDNHDNPRMGSKIDREGKYHDKVNKLLATLLLTLRGTPYIYQGQEIGMTDYPFSSLDEFRDVEARNFHEEILRRGLSEKEAIEHLRTGSRDNARTPMQWDTTSYAGFSETEPWIAVNPNYHQINVETEEKDPDSILNYYRKLIAFRKKHQCLIYGSFRKLKTNKNILAYERFDDNEKYLIIINLTNKERRNPIPVDGTLILSNYPETTGRLRPYEAMVIRKN